jgi:hypothetical protein
MTSGVRVPDVGIDFPLATNLAPGRYVIAMTVVGLPPKNQVYVIRSNLLGQVSGRCDGDPGGGTLKAKVWKSELPRPAGSDRVSPGKRCRGIVRCIDPLVGVEGLDGRGVLAGDGCCQRFSWDRIAVSSLDCPEIIFHGASDNPSATIKKYRMSSLSLLWDS